MIGVRTPEIKAAVEELLKLWNDEIAVGSPEEMKAHHEKLIKATSNLLALYGPLSGPEITFNW